MAVQARCSQCKRVYSLADTMLGKKVRCKGCGTVFDVQPQRPLEAVPAPPLPRDGVRGGKPRSPAVRRQDDEEDDERYDEEDDDRPRRRRRRKEKTKSPIVLIAGIASGVVSFVLAFLLVSWLMRKPARQPVALAPLPAAPIAPAQPQPAQPAPVPAQKRVAKAAPVPVEQGEEPAGLYGDQGGAEIAPADPGLPNTVLRARADDTFYRISNPRIGQGRFPGPPGPVLQVDWEIVRHGKHKDMHVVYHSGDGRRQTIGLGGGGPNAPERGTFELRTFGFGGGPFGGGFAKNAEFYLVRSDGRFGKKAPTFMVSNSATMGDVPVTTKVRNWTPEEINLYTGEPPPLPNYEYHNRHPNVGQDTAFAPPGGGSHRFVEPGGRLLGLDYRLGNWAGETCLGTAIPVFSLDQPLGPNTVRVLAKEGYAVAGAEVHTGKHVTGIKLLFRKLKADGSLDPADAYASDLMGYMGQGAPTILANDGRRVIGIHNQQGIVLDRFALVVDR